MTIERRGAQLWRKGLARDGKDTIYPARGSENERRRLKRKAK